jgi:arsenical pump membrane protein
MLILQFILAGAAVAAVALYGAGWRSIAPVAALAALAVALGAPLLPALASAAPLVLFLTAALTLAAVAEAAGLADRAADALARWAGGRGVVLYAMVCLVCTLATAVVSLDGAVVLMVPLLLALAHRHGAQLEPLLLGTVAVANAASIAVPQGNPTNLVLIERMGIAPGEFAQRMALPGLAAAAACALGAALLERRALNRPYARPRQITRSPLTRRQRHTAIGLALAGLATACAPVAGVPMWWVLPAVAGLVLVLHPAPRPRPTVPSRLALQLIGLLVLIGWLGARPAISTELGPLAIVALAAAIGVAAALANNLPVSVSAGSLLGAGSTGYAATIGLGVGALATPQGSIATLLAADLAGSGGSILTARRLAPLAGAGVVAATVVLAAVG